MIYHGTVYQMKGFIRYDLSWYSVSSYCIPALRSCFWLQMEISKYLRQESRAIAGKSQFFINSYAKALEVGGDGFHVSGFM